MNFELKIQVPKNAPVMFNYDELKANLTVALADYQNRIYTEDTINEAKEDRAKLNKLRKALNDERIAREKEYMQPFETFKDQAKELCEMIDTASSGISEQLDAFEEKRTAEKRERIENLYADIISNYDFGFILPLDKIFKDRWLNKSTSEKTICEEITESCERIISELEVIRKMPQYAFEAEEAYKETLDLRSAFDIGGKMFDIQTKKRQAAAGEDSGERFEVAFKCEITIEQAKALKAFCQENGIKLIQIKE